MGKGFKIFLIILLSIIAIALSGILAILIMRSPSTNLVFSLGESYSEELIDEKNIEELKDIRVNINDVDVVVETGNTDNINVKLYSDNPEDYRISNDKELEIVLKSKKKFFNIFKKNARVLITVPSSFENKITVNGTVGDVKVKDLPNASLFVDKTTGDVKIDNINSANIKITVGDIKITKINRLDIKSNTGDIKLGSINEYLNIDNTTGDIKIEKAKLTENSIIKNNIGDIKINTINDIYVDAKTNVGDIKVNNNNRLGEYELTITNNIGDIKVG
jgi:DUF4097 and DUF4098 domain-containing protein YvlB